MTGWLIDDWQTVGFVALSSALIYVSMIVGLRLGERRALTELTTYDFVVAVALGSIVGRTATTETPSYVQGLAALVTLLVVHRIISAARRRSGRLRLWTDGEPLLLVVDGAVRDDGLRRAQMTRADLAVALRERGVRRLDEIEAVVLEARGALSVIRRGDDPVDELLRVEPHPDLSRR